MVRTKAEGKLAPSTALAPVPVTGALPLMWFSLRRPLTSHPNAFWPLAGFLHLTNAPVVPAGQPLVAHAGDRYAWGSHRPAENGMISSGAFLPVKIELTPSFSVRVAGRSTQAPGTGTLIAARKAAAVPDPGWGRSGR